MAHWRPVEAALRAAIARAAPGRRLGAQGARSGERLCGRRDGAAAGLRGGRSADRDPRRAAAPEWPQRVARRWAAPHSSDRLIRSFSRSGAGSLCAIPLVPCFGSSPSSARGPNIAMNCATGSRSQARAASSGVLGRSRSRLPAFTPVMNAASPSARRSSVISRRLFQAGWCRRRPRLRDAVEDAVGEQEVLPLDRTPEHLLALLQPHRPARRRGVIPQWIMSSRALIRRRRFKAPDILNPLLGCCRIPLTTGQHQVLVQL